MLIELGFGLSLASLYWWEVEQWGLFPELMTMRPGQAVSLLAPLTLTMTHQQFAVHVILLALMLVATFIDIDEKMIPDSVTDLGALAGLALAAAMPWSLLPAAVYVPMAGFAGPNVIQVEFLHVAAPLAWPAELSGVVGVVLGLICFWAWCFALLPRTWYGRHGVRRAVQLCLARMTRGRGFQWVAFVGLLGSASIVGVWVRGGASWAGLLTALVGMAVGGGIIWAVRLIGYAVLRREAMGFGDVTLMAMIGAFCGWQICLIVFLLAPLVGVVVAVSQWLLRRDDEIPYGPFLCLAAAVVVIGWAPVWDRAYPYFYSLGWLIPAIGGLSLVAMALLLWLMQIAKRLLGITK
jgi:prepilin signal peptidase PulO-like enzyme (type II secretory pathway)